MTLTLFSSEASPFVRFVRIAIVEADLTDHITVLNVATTAYDTDPALAAANPLGKIPALMREDGPTLFDSRVIVRYLNTLADAGFYPDSRIWDVQTLEAMGLGMADSSVAMVYEKRFRDPEHVTQRWIDAQWDKVDRTLTALEGQWMSHLAGPVTAGQMAVAAALGYHDFRHPDRNWRASHDSLASWFEEFSARPSMQATMPVG